MALVSLTFILFFAIVAAVYYLVPGKLQWIVLLVSSFIFYFLTATPYTVVYMLVSIVTVYLATCKIEKLGEEQTKEKRVIYIAAVVICVGMLAALKYMNFFLGNVKLIAHLFGRGEGIPQVHWIAALGISFYTLQMVGYLTDVYWGISKAQKNIAKLALFNCYFPQLISGPISRYQEIEKDLFGVHKFEKEKFYLGCLRILTGFFKKLVITEHLTQVTNAIYSNPAEYSGVFIWIGTVLYVIEIYADFSGCMDIVIGVSECFGIYLPENFKTPFCSVTIQEFWQRWHITLGAWLKDYIMFPVMRSRLWNKYAKTVKKKWGKKAGKFLPTFTAMLILWFGMGLWHGGGWNYIGEGVWFWLVIVLGQVLEPMLSKVTVKCKIKTEGKAWYCFRCTRTAFIYAVGALFFKADNLKMALYMLKVAISPAAINRTVKQLPAVLLALDGKVGTMQIGWTVLSVAVGTMIMVALGICERRERPFRQWMVKQKMWVNGLVLYVILVMILLLGAYGPGYSSSEFIYGGF